MKKLNQITSGTIAVLSSRRTFYVVIGVFIIESLWVALSFRFPLLFDERYHFDVINIFSHGFSPIITDQPPAYDLYGSLTFGSASLFHYLMSFPNRAILLFTNDLFTQVVILRILNILMAASGLWLFGRVFRTIGIKQIYVNISLFFYSLIPLVIFIAATISYDNMLLPLTGGFMLAGLKILQNKGNKAIDYTLFIVIGLFATLVKFTFLPVFVGSMIYVVIVEIRKSGRSTVRILIESFKSIRISTKILLLIIFLIMAGLFSARYIVAIAKYGSPIPECAKVLSQQRCSVGGVSAMEMQARATKDQRQAEPIERYAQHWVETVILHLDTSAGSISPTTFEMGKSLPIFSLLMVGSIFIGVGFLLYAWRSISKNNGWTFLIFIVWILVVSVFGFNAISYYSAHEDLNTQGRYLLSIIPVVLVMSTVSISYVLNKKRKLKVAILLIVLIMSLQGGGVIKHILNGQDNWYWDKPIIIKANHVAKKILQPIVKETNIFN